MAEDDEKLDSRRIMSELPPIQTFGANKEVVNIIEAAGRHRDQLEGNLWSLADFFRYQGPNVLPFDGNTRDTPQHTLRYSFTLHMYIECLIY